MLYTVGFMAGSHIQYCIIIIMNSVGLGVYRML